MGEDKASTFDGGLWGNVHQGSSFPPVPPMQEPDGPLAAKSCRTAMRLISDVAERLEASWKQSFVNVAKFGRSHTEPFSGVIKRAGPSGKTRENLIGSRRGI